MLRGTARIRQIALFLTQGPRVATATDAIELKVYSWDTRTLSISHKHGRKIICSSRGAEECTMLRIWKNLLGNQHERGKKWFIKDWYCKVRCSDFEFFSHFSRC
jgi:hypothetical protein